MARSLFRCFKNQTFKIEELFQKVLINPRIFQKPILGLTALLGFLVGRWLQIEMNESGDNSLSVFGAQLPRGGGDWSAAILFEAVADKSAVARR